MMAHWNYRVRNYSNIHEAPETLIPFPEMEKQSIVYWAEISGLINESQKEFLLDNLDCVEYHLSEENGEIWHNYKLMTYEYDKRRDSLDKFHKAISKNVVFGNRVKSRWSSKNVLSGSASSFEKNVGKISIRYNKAKRTVTITGNVANFPCDDIARHILWVSFSEMTIVRTDKRITYTLK